MPRIEPECAKKYFGDKDVMININESIMDLVVAVREQTEAMRIDRSVPANVVYPIRTASPAEPEKEPDHE